MFDFITRGSEAPSHGLNGGLRRSLAVTFAFVVAVACTILVTVLHSRSQNERQAILSGAGYDASALSLAFDQEVAAVHYLLQGLSKSPPLLSGDTRAFYEQLKATPVPDGAWLILYDQDRQLINTLLPYADPSLPANTATSESRARIRDRGWSVSGRLYGAVKRAVVVALSLRINDPDGEMRRWITTILSELRLSAILRGHPVDAAHTKALYDRSLQLIVAERHGQTVTDLPAAQALIRRLSDAGPTTMITGLVEGVDHEGIPMLFAFRRSGVTNWTTVVGVPLAAVNAPLNATLGQTVLAAGFLLFTGGLAALLAARRVERPLTFLSTMVRAAESRVTQLSDQLLAVQEEERQRIARELHDSTTQHIVAASLSISRLEAESQHSPSAQKAFAQIEQLLERALLELRIFSYLLHPPNLAVDGLRLTLQDFIEGFAERTELKATVSISPAVNAVSLEIQRSILRVVQEALSNVYRHAGATHVSITVKWSVNRLVIRVLDDGHGIKASDNLEARPRLGVGISGMRARLQQFGGELKIKTGASGTVIIAYIPLKAVGSTKIKPAD